MLQNIFSKQSILKPTSLAAVAERRFEDAQALCDTGQNARANGAAYLAGFVVEILLKAKLIAMHPATARKCQHEVNEADRDIWRLIWKAQDLEAMLEAMPSLEAAIKKKSDHEGASYLNDLKGICAMWTIQARYSTHTTTVAKVADLLVRLRTLKELLK